MSEGPTVSIIMFLVLLLFDMIFFGFGEAIQCLNTKEIERKSKEDKDIKSKKIVAIISEPTSFINTLQLVTTIIHIIMGGSYLGLWYQGIHKFVEYKTSQVIENTSFISLEMISILSLIMTAILMVYIILTIGILMPKCIAKKYPATYANFLITPVYYIVKILSPFTGLVSITAKCLLRLIGIRENIEDVDVTEEEIISMINEGHEQGVFQAREAEMITNIFEYGDKEAKDIMTHRINIITIDGKMPLNEVVAFMLQERNSRFPVYMESIDSIIGILHLKDALRFHAMDYSCEEPIFEIEGLIREAEFIPERRNIDILFKTMQTMKIQMVIVVDEYGQTAGVVSMEDILEEIFGDILDEYDDDDDFMEEKSENEFVLEGMIRLEDITDRFGIEFLEEEFETLNGFLIAKMERIPKENEDFEIEIGGYNFKVLTVEHKIIQSVLLTKLKEKIVETTVEVKV